MTVESAPPTTVDPSEIAKFAAMAEEWWDPAGKFEPLHRLNPARLTYIRDTICRRFDRDPRARHPLENLKILDLGCGGGLVSEPLCRLGANVVGIDMVPQNVEIARAHARAHGLEIDYRQSSAEQLVAAHDNFDVVLALEIIEHVADIGLFVEQCCRLVGAGGVLIFSTINRTPKAYALAIVGAEYIMRWLPRGTHEFDKFVKPNEISSKIDQSLFIVDSPKGLSYDLLNGRWYLSDDDSVNYFLTAHRQT